MILGLSSADGGMTVGLWKLSLLNGRRPPWYRPQTVSGARQGGHYSKVTGVTRPGKAAIIFFFFFCGRSAVLRPSVHMLPGIGWCGAGLPPFPTVCWWLTHPAAITGVSVSARRDSPGGCSGPSVPLLCNRGVQSPRCQFASGALAGHSVLFATWI